MSRSNPQNPFTPSQIHSNDQPYTEVPEAERHYVGRNKGKVDVFVQAPDRYEYERWKASRRLGRPEWELADEPDFDNRLDNVEDKEIP